MYHNSESSDDDERSTVPAKRPRNFIARQACEACRARKTRCDQETPCGFCRSQGIQCVYMERKPTRNEASLGMILDRMIRIESKLDHLSNPHNENIYAPPADLIQPSPQGEAPQILTPMHLPDIHRTINPGESPYGDTKFSFSTRQTLCWPGIQPIQSPGSLPLGSFSSGLLSNAPEGFSGCLSDIELDGPAFPQSAGAKEFPDNWLTTLSLSTVKGLSNAFFSTFNRIFPFIDRDYYFLNTLSTVVGEGFNYDIESCLVLSVMALGCLGTKAYEEGGYHNEDTFPMTETMQSLMNEEVPGKSLFNESRRRIGLCLCAKDIQVSQYYLTAALFYSQAMRPVDQWMMTDRASTNCLIFWTHLRNRSDKWMSDMQSRIFWSALLIETVIAQEMDLPTSRLRELEDVVPLPKFIAYPNVKKVRTQRSDESYYNYHFLAQIAHRIILIRIRDEMYHFNPSATVANELRHQLDQWRTNLPMALQFDDNQRTFSCPAEAYATSLLRTRFRSAIYHLGRPFLYKALSNPTLISDQELNFCSEALLNASNWPIATGVCRKMSSFSFLKYFVGRSFFGTLSIWHALKESKNDRLQKVLPEEAGAECSYMLEYIDELALLSPSLQKDREVLSLLYGPPLHQGLQSE